MYNFRETLVGFFSGIWHIVLQGSLNQTKFIHIYPSVPFCLCCECHGDKIGGTWWSPLCSFSRDNNRGVYPPLCVWGGTCRVAHIQNLKQELTDFAALLTYRNVSRCKYSGALLRHFSVKVLWIRLLWHDRINYLLFFKVPFKVWIIQVIRSLNDFFLMISVDCLFWTKLVYAGFYRQRCHWYSKINTYTSFWCFHPLKVVQLVPSVEHLATSLANLFHACPDFWLPCQYISAECLWWDCDIIDLQAMHRQAEVLLWE